MEGEMLADRFERLNTPTKVAISSVIVALCVWVVWSGARDMGWM
jgi:hypothetical protein